MKAVPLIAGARPFRLLARYFAISFLRAQRVSRLRARPKGFPIALWKPSGPCLPEDLQTTKPEVSSLSVSMAAWFFQGVAPVGTKWLSGFCKMSFLLERGSAGQGGRGDSDLPPMPPWTPYTPFKRPRDTPGPPLWRKGYFPLFLDRQGPHRARHWVWSGASNQSGAGAGTRFVWHRCRGRVLLQDGLAVAAPCRHSKDKPVPWSRGRDQLRRRRQWPSQGRT